MRTNAANDERILADQKVCMKTYQGKRQCNVSFMHGLLVVFEPHAHARTLSNAYSLTLSHKMHLLAECEHDLHMQAPDVLDDPAVRIANEVQFSPTLTH